jgi:hypothetical protein
MPTLYIAGPMTGLPDYNWPAFRLWTRRLRDVGYAVVSPVELVEQWRDQSKPFTRDDYHRAMRDGFRAIVGHAHIAHDGFDEGDGPVDGLAYLDGWNRSRGALAEVHVANMTGVEVGHVELWFARGRGAS